VDYSSTGENQTLEAWAGIIIAGFSKEWKEGKWDQIDRIPMNRGHKWALKSLRLSKKVSARLT